jgi:hypothetical protein
MVRRAGFDLAGVGYVSLTDSASGIEYGVLRVFN